MKALTIEENIERAKSLNIDLLDAQLFLMHLLKCSRAYLITRSEDVLPAEVVLQFNDMLNRRAQGEPVAYILAKKSFWKLDFEVSAAVLIPRPETEMLIEWVLNAFSSDQNALIADLGTGSGAIALSLAHDRPNWQVIATDFSSSALEIAKRNASIHQINNVSFYQGSWCDALPDVQFDAIISNPPYIGQEDPHLLGDIRYEPRSALVAPDEGFADLVKIAKEARRYLKPSGYLVLEHGWTQAERLQKELASMGYDSVQTFKDLAGQDRMTVARTCHASMIV